MDIPVQIVMVVLAVFLAAGGISGLLIGKHWTDYLAGICCLLGAGIVAYGLYIQCDNMAVFYRCGG